MRQIFGGRVRGMRERKGISLRKFALMIGIDKGFLVDVELGRKAPTLDTIEKITAGLDVTMGELFDGIEIEVEQAAATSRIRRTGGTPK